MQTLCDQKNTSETKSCVVLAGSIKVNLQQVQVMPFGKLPELPALSPSLLSKNDLGTKSHAEWSLELISQSPKNTFSQPGANIDLCESSFGKENEINMEHNSQSYPDRQFREAVVIVNGEE